MSSVLDLIASHMSPETIGAMSRQIGADEDSTHDAIGAALPLIVAAIARNAARADGAASLGQALQRDHEGSILDDVMGAVQSPDTISVGSRILAHVMGGGRPVVEKGLSHASGLTGDQSGRLLALLAPIVLGALGKQAGRTSLDPASLSSMLGREGAHARESMPAHGSILASLLDANGNGSVLAELGTMGMSVLSGLMTQRND